MFYDQVAEYKESFIHKRGDQYELFKKNKTEKFIRKIEKYFGDRKIKLFPECSATPLTFRDFLNNYDGSAYGIKQKIGQFSLFGRLKARNVFVCGQNSLLPGIVGSMWSSVVIARQILGADNFDAYCKRKLS